MGYCSVLCVCAGVVLDVHYSGRRSCSRWSHGTWTPTSRVCLTKSARWGRIFKGKDGEGGGLEAFICACFIFSFQGLSCSALFFLGGGGLWRPCSWRFVYRIHFLALSTVSNVLKKLTTVKMMPSTICWLTLFPVWGPCLWTGRVKKSWRLYSVGFISSGIRVCSMIVFKKYFVGKYPPEQYRTVWHTFLYSLVYQPIIFQFRVYPTQRTLGNCSVSSSHKLFQCARVV